MTLTKFPATITSIKQLSPDTKSFTLQTEKFTFKAGQFIMLNVPFKDTKVRRAYSMANAPSPASEDGNHIEICLNYVKGGKASEYLFNVKEGETMDIDGPYGIFTVKENPNNKVFICTGTGVVPLRSMILQLLKTNPKENISLIFGKRAEEDLLYREEFEALQQKHPNFTYIPVLSNPHNGWQGKTGYVQHNLTPADSTDYYICGLKEMVNDTKAALEKARIKKDNIFVERYV